MPEKKTPKPKAIAQATITLMDDGQLAGDFWIWEEDEIGRRKKWTVAGDEFFKFVYRVAPNVVPVIAAAFNVQIIMAKLPEELQGPWVRWDEETDHLTTLKDQVITPRPPVHRGNIGDQIADGYEMTAANEMGMSPADAAAALPDNMLAKAAASNAAPVTPPQPSGGDVEAIPSSPSPIKG